MAGIYISGMEMPKNCGSCKLVKSFTIDSELILYCSINGEAYCKERKGCPLIPVPNHGRSIDADALYAEVKKRATPSDAWVFSLIRTASTVIPADEEG